MTNNFDAESAKKIIFDDNINVTESNTLKDLVQILFNIVLIVVSIYFFIFIASGVVLKSLSPEQQIVVENIISPFVDPDNIIELSEVEKQKLKNIKNNILKADSKFPTTSNLEINVIKSKQLNALCYPNGNIYITSALYDELKSD